MDVMGFFILLGMGWMLGVLLLSAYTAWMLTHPPRRTTGYAVSRNLPSTPAEVRVVVDGAERALEYSEWTVRHARGAELPVWDIGGLNAAGPIVVVTHGWGDSRVVMLTRVSYLVKHARRVLVWDLPAHGDSPRGSSKAFTLGLREHQTLRALIATVRASDATTPIVLYGYSLGAGISIAAAAEDEPQIGGNQAGSEREDEGRRESRRDGARRSAIAGVIAESPYRVPITPAENVLKQTGMPHALNLPLAMLALGLRHGQGAAWLQRSGAGGFDRRELAQQLRVPLLVLHGTADRVCPVDDGRTIAAAPRRDGNTGTLVEIDGGGHLDLWTAEKFAGKSDAAVQRFLAAVKE